MNRIIRVNQQSIARLERAPIVRVAECGFKGRYKLEAMRPDGRMRPLTGWFDNLITDFGLNQLGTLGGQLNNVFVGSGNTPPSNGDTSLVSLVAQTNNIITSTGAAQPSSPYFGTRTNTYQFGQGAAAGNLAEVGVGRASSGLWSRALILDGSSNPTTITVLSDEFLNVTYEMQLYPIVTDTTGTVVIAGVTYNYTARAANVTIGNWTPSGGLDAMVVQNLTAFSGTIGAITGSPAGTGSGPNNIAPGTYSSNSLVNTAVGTWGLTQANFGSTGVRALQMNWGDGATGGAYQISLDNAGSPGNGVPKDGTQVMTLTCEVSWGRGQT